MPEKLTEPNLDQPSGVIGEYGSRDVSRSPERGRRVSVSRRTLAMVLAGGEGKRLAPLTAERAKPAVVFGGDYRLIDFVLSNLVNGGYGRVVVLTQYKSQSLNRHIARTWPLPSLLGNYVATVPAQMRNGPHWFAGSADAILQNLNLIDDEAPDYILVFGADHIYRMDPRQMVEQHVASGADVTVAAVRVPLRDASSFGVIVAGDRDRILSFREKPSDAVGLSGTPDQAFASMGNYVFTTQALIDAVIEDGANEQSGHDIGGDIIPMLVRAGSASVYDFATNEVSGATERDRAYWRDVGTLDSYYDAHMDLISVHPVFNLYNQSWPIYSWHAPVPPAKFVFDEEGRRGVALNSMVSAGAIIAGGTVRNSVLSPSVVVHSHALVEGSVLMHGVSVGEGAVVCRAIVDKYVDIPPGAQIGVDPQADRERYAVSDRGVVVIARRRKSAGGIATGQDRFGPGRLLSDGSLPLTSHSTAAELSALGLPSPRRPLCPSRARSRHANVAELSPAGVEALWPSRRAEQRGDPF